MDSEKSRTCQFCSKLFANRPNRVRHANHYCKANPNVQLKKQTDTLLVPEQTRISGIEQKLQELIDVIKNKESAPNSVHYGDNIQNNILLVNNYGAETLEHLNHQFLSECITQRKKGLVNLLDKLYFDPKMPQNHTVKIVSKKREVMGTFKDGNWLVASKNSILDEMIQKGYRILYKHYMATVDVDEDDELGKPEDASSYFDFLQNVSNIKSNMYYQVRKDLFLMVENATLYIVGK